MKILKVNQIEKNHLTKKQMSTIVGGAACGCACCDEEGSTKQRDSNTSANYATANDKRVEFVFLQKI